MTERMWCTACGTVTRDGICDCNTYGVGHEMYREPNLVNYADAMQEAAHEQAQLVAALIAALRPLAIRACDDAAIELIHQIEGDLPDPVGQKRGCGE